ncbi:glutamate synthase central domain-containing protein, partial [Stenotrophomonas sp. SrG]|uniref:glutamate synthase central domain-containing protein n=1 Tax=Stenotrophomonas sp. SrG TaxID=3414430 RepID=UPI003CF6B1AE
MTAPPARHRAEPAAAARAGHDPPPHSARHPDADRPRVPALQATSAVHPHRSNARLRCDVNQILATATARDPHPKACLLAFSATPVY